VPTDTPDTGGISTLPPRLTWLERRAAMDAGLCCNGCQEPIALPSKVVCQGCLGRMGAELRGMLRALEDTGGGGT
jgi:predicted amidophosphoribosyltransferase